MAKRKGSHGARYQSIQVYIEVKTTRETVKRLTWEFFRDCLESIILGDEVPNVTVSSVVWVKNGKPYEYEDEDVIDCLQRAVSVFGINRVARSIKTRHDDNR